MIDTLNIFKGRKGNKGASGVDGVGADDIRYSLIESPLLHLFAPNSISKTVTPNWSRADQGSIVDRYGSLKFIGGDTVSNLLSYSEDFSQWQDPNNYWTIDSASEADPLGGFNARRISLDQTTTPSGVNIMGIPYTINSSGLHTFSVWIRAVSGAVENVGVQGTTGGAVFTLSDEVTGDWQRISLTYNVSPLTNIFYINVYGFAGVVFDIFGAQFESNPQVGQYIKTTGIPFDGPNPENRWRENENGFLIEGSKENKCTFSQNLLGATWDIAGGSISQFSEVDPTGSTNSNILVNFTSPNVSLSQASAFNQGEQYTVSMWIYVESGSLDSVLCSVGNGTANPIEFSQSERFIRVFVNCTAGSDNSFLITLTSGDTSSKVAVFGVQVESGSLSSYIKTEDNAASRSADDVDISYYGNFQRPSDEWSILMSIVFDPEISGNRYIISNSQSGNDEFSIYVNSTNLTIKNGSSESTIPLTSNDIEITHNSGVLKIYQESELILSETITPTDFVSSTMLLGQTQGSIGQFNGLIANLLSYDKELTSDELRAIRGSDK